MSLFVAWLRTGGAYAYRIAVSSVRAHGSKQQSFAWFDRKDRGQPNRVGRRFGGPSRATNGTAYQIAARHQRLRQRTFGKGDGEAVEESAPKELLARCASYRGRWSVLLP